MTRRNVLMGGSMLLGSGLAALVRPAQADVTFAEKFTERERKMNAFAIDMALEMNPDLWRLFDDHRLDVTLTRDKTVYGASDIFTKTRKFTVNNLPGNPELYGRHIRNPHNPRDVRIIIADGLYDPRLLGLLVLTVTHEMTHADNRYGEYTGRRARRGVSLDEDKLMEEIETYTSVDNHCWAYRRTEAYRTFLEARLDPEYPEELFEDVVNLFLAAFARKTRKLESELAALRA